MEKHPLALTARYQGIVVQVLLLIGWRVFSSLRKDVDSRITELLEEAADIALALGL
jgi:hypothetical protein